MPHFHLGWVSLEQFGSARPRMGWLYFQSHLRRMAVSKDMGWLRLRKALAKICHKVIMTTQILSNIKTFDSSHISQKLIRSCRRLLICVLHTNADLSDNHTICGDSDSAAFQPDPFNSFSCSPITAETSCFSATNGGYQPSSRLQ